jgi:hypothetical protein
MVDLVGGRNQRTCVQCRHSRRYVPSWVTTTVEQFHEMALLEHSPKQTLYQFCSLAGFKGIIASKALWYTDLRSANDPRELNLGFEHFIDAMKFVREHDYPGPDGHFLQSIADELVQQNKTRQFFCACFSTVEDVLPMWREYGDGCRGLAIGFRPTAIISMPGRIQKIRYLNPDTPDDFRRLVRDITGHFNPTHSANDMRWWANTVASILAALTALKHHTWEYEKEIRIVFTQSSDSDRSIPLSLREDKTKIFWEKPLSRARGNQCVEYKSFQFGRQKDGVYDFSKAIARVVVGSRCELSIDEVTSELRTNGFTDFDVIRSECLIQ